MCHSSYEKIETSTFFSEMNTLTAKRHQARVPPLSFFNTLLFSLPAHFENTLFSEKCSYGDVKVLRRGSHYGHWYLQTHLNISNACADGAAAVHRLANSTRFHKFQRACGFRACFLSFPRFHQSFMVKGSFTPKGQKRTLFFSSPVEQVSATHCL